MRAFDRRVGLLAAAALAGCIEPPGTRTLHAPIADSPSGVTVREGRVGAECLWADKRVVCTVVAEHVVDGAPPGTAVEYAAEDIATSIRAGGVLVEPFAPAKKIRVELPAAPAPARLAATWEVVLRAGDSRFEDESPTSSWSITHPIFGQNEMRYEFTHILYCFAATGAPPAFGPTRIPDGLVIWSDWQIGAADPYDCGASARTATLALRTAPRRIVNGGPVLSAGYVIREGFAAEVGYDVGIGRFLAVEAAVRIATNGELDAIPLFGFPFAVKVGLPIDTATGDLAFRVQSDIHLAFPRWVAAPGLVYFYENWQNHPNRWGFMGSVAF